MQIRDDLRSASGLKRSTPLLVIGVMAVACVLRLADKHFNLPLPPAGPTPPVVIVNHPQIEIRFPHLCCSGCGHIALVALNRLPWWEVKNGRNDITRLGAALPAPHPKDRTSRVAQPLPPGTDYSGTLLGNARRDRLSQIDFLRLIRTVRQEGLVPDRIVLRGLARFQLVADLPHFCCPTCRDGAGETAVGIHLPHQVGAVWVDEVQHQVVAAFNDEADVTAFEQAVERSGFAPQSITVHTTGGR